MRLRHVLAVTGVVVLVPAVVAAPAEAGAAAERTWPPFALVAGLLLLGLAAEGDGLFLRLGAAAARRRAHPAVLLVGLLGVVAVVTAVLNLDTSVAFLTPVLVLAARSRGLDEEPFLYGALVMSNAASLLLPGSNLTNLLVLAHDRAAGAVFAGRMLPAWLASVAVTALFTLAVHRHRLHDHGSPAARPPARGGDAGAGVTTAGIALTVVVMLALPSPALPVLAVGVATAGAALARRKVTPAAIDETVDPASLAGLFGIAVALGTLAGVWHGPADLMATSGPALTAVVGAVAAVVLNNLPASALLASEPPAHPYALLLGLDLGPNLAVTGSLAALIWYRAGRSVGARMSLRRFTRLGLVLVPLSMTAAAAALHLFPAP